MNTTIVYYTDHSLKEPLFSQVIDHLKKTVGDYPIVSVSHTPIDLGKNIAIGKRKRSWLLLYQQLLKGVEAAETKYVAMAEHDCLYPREHFEFIPPRDDTFYYDENARFVQWEDNNHLELRGMYSSWPEQRLALSSLICNRALLEKTLNDRLDLLDRDRKLVREIIFAGEPGLSRMRVEKARKWAASGRPAWLKDYLKEQLDREKYGTFRSEHPYLDIRHGNNFTGPRRGKNREFSDPYWGKFEEVIGA